jgi:hypothetical protein
MRGCPYHFTATSADTKFILLLSFKPSRHNPRHARLPLPFLPSHPQILIYFTAFIQTFSSQPAPCAAALTIFNRHIRRH